MNLNAGKAYRAPLGFASLLGAVVLVVLGKSVTGGGQPAAALSMPGGPAASSHPTAASQSTDAATIPTPSATANTAATGGTAGTGGVTAAPTTAATGKRTVVGDAEDTRYGPVQVELVLQDSKITDVVTLQLPNQERRDIEINNQAVPILRQEVLAAQSAKIDAVSGASYTSSGYAWSVQSALDKAGIKS
jgi:uncharacterized protein with FMN-binding domain